MLQDEKLWWETYNFGDHLAEFKDKWIDKEWIM